MNSSSGFSFLSRLITASDTRVGVLMAATGLAVFVWLLMGPAPWVAAPGHYLILHSIAEILVVVIAALTFVTGWHIHEQKQSVASVMVVCGALSIALLDLAHLMSYQGMPDFITPNSPHKAIIFWLAARLVAATLFLLYVVMPEMTVRTPRLRYWLLAANLLLVAVITTLTLVWSDWVPATFIDGQGVTRGKILMEGVVIVLHLVTLVLLAKRQVNLKSNNARLLGMAVLLSIVSELFFTSYVDVTDLSNGLGHVYKVIAYLYLYRVIYLENVRGPIIRLREAQKQVEESASRYQQLLETAPDAILVADEQGSIRMINQRLEDMFGYSRAELIGRELEVLVPESFRERHRNLRQGYHLDPQERPMSAMQDLEAVRKDGSRIPVDISLTVSSTDHGKQVTAFIRDVTSWRQLEAELRHLATHDVLTGLPNRALFRSRLEQELAQATRHRRILAVMLLDLDNFKTVNDSWGHLCGDNLLIQTSRRLQACTRQGDTVARLGGDEFAMILTSVREVGDLGRIADKLLKSLEPSYTLNGREISTGGSLGISLYPNDGQTGEELLANADAAMYDAKAAGRHCYRFYTAELNRQTQENLTIQARLRHALEEGGLELHYQPQVNGATGGISGVEALLRWQDAELGFVSPARFIPVAESSGLILALGDWVIRTACRQIREWLDAGVPTRVAVNLSARQFRQNDLVERVRDSIAEFLVPAALLELEVTESALMEDADEAARMLTELSDLGVQLAIDDFGTGYSSLNYLKKFPLDKLKIDRSFVQDVPMDASDSVIVKAIIGLARNLGLELVAEGVETQVQLDYLRSNGCDEYQGYLFSKPVPASQCLALLRSNRQQTVARNAG